MSPSSASIESLDLFAFDGALSPSFAFDPDEDILNDEEGFDDQDDTNIGLDEDDHHFTNDEIVAAASLAEDEEAPALGPQEPSVPFSSTSFSSLESLQYVSSPASVLLSDHEQMANRAPPSSCDVPLLREDSFQDGAGSYRTSEDGKMFDDFHISFGNPLPSRPKDQKRATSKPHKAEKRKQPLKRCSAMVSSYRSFSDVPNRPARPHKRRRSMVPPPSVMKRRENRLRSIHTADPKNWLFSFFNVLSTEALLDDADRTIQWMRAPGKSGDMLLRISSEAFIDKYGHKKTFRLTQITGLKHQLVQFAFEAVQGRKMGLPSQRGSADATIFYTVPGLKQGMVWKDFSEMAAAACKAKWEKGASTAPTGGASPHKGEVHIKRKACASSPTTVTDYGKVDVATFGQEAGSVR